MPRDLLNAISLKNKLAAAVAAGVATRIGDGDGLMLVVRPNGEASWVLRYRHRGARKDLTLGRWPTVTLKLAREAANEARVASSTGTDPALLKVVPPPVVRGANVRTLFEHWLDTSERSAVYRHNIEAAFTKDVLPVIGAMQPHEVERETVVKILREIEERGAVHMVRRVRMWMRQMFDFGIEHEGWPNLKASPIMMGMLKTFKSRKARHFPAITNADEVPALMRKVRAITDNIVIRNALLLSAHVFQRPTEIREATWPEFDLDAAMWKIPPERMKGRLEHWVPLSPKVVALLRMHRGIVGESGYLFPGRRYGQPISEGTLTGRLNTMGYLGKHSPHGFRAMARTVLDEVLKVDPRFIEKQLAHETDASGLRGAYNRAAYWDERVKMMSSWSDWLEAA